MTFSEFSEWLKRQNAWEPVSVDCTNSRRLEAQRKGRAAAFTFGELRRMAEKNASMLGMAGDPRNAPKRPAEDTSLFPPDFEPEHAP
jgi:hypothetical protein